MLWVGLPVVMLLGMVTLIVLAAQGGSFQVTDSRGLIADAQRDTLFLATAIMAIIVVPVFLLTALISVRYRERNKSATYKPTWASSRKLELLWWGGPVLIVTVLSVIAWQTTHSLDPYRPITSTQPPLKVQVVALQWKWLFLYPEHDIASVNELVMPVGRPVEFSITSDAPMNSFWIPRLGGQIYAMPGMNATLHLQADEAGTYRGVSANLSGEGFADMDFSVRAHATTGFNEWLDAPAAQVELTNDTYERLRLPSKETGVSRFTMNSDSLYDEIIARYEHTHAAQPSTDTHEDHH